MNLFKNKNNIYEKVIKEKIKNLEKERDKLWEKCEEEVKRYDWKVDYDEFINNDNYSKVGYYMRQMNFISYKIWTLKEVLQEVELKRD